MVEARRATPQVLVCHAGRQHSHQLAIALAEYGMLAKYVTGLPTRRDAGGWLGRRFFPRVAEAYAIDLDPALVSNVYITTIVRKAAAAICAPALAATVSQRADGLFDRYVSGLVSSLRPDVVVAYENCALHTFRRAKRLGIKTVLDVASVHHRWQDHFFPPAQGWPAHRWTIARKDAEIELADELLTVSRLARESYIEAGVPKERVTVIPVGVDTLCFRPRGGHDESGRAARDFRFVYVGNAAPLKGLDVLAAAVRSLRADGEPCTAALIGAIPADAAADGLLRMGWMDHARLATELPRHDVLVLPSFFDSFGMVVAEAMACGLPAIVTENVGAKQMIAPGANGLIVPQGDVEALASAMRWFVQNRDKLPQMSCAARESAERYDWAHYRKRAAEFFHSL